MIIPFPFRDAEVTGTLISLKFVFISLLFEVG